MEAVLAVERALGRQPRDVSADKVGYDVKSRIAGGNTITVTTNEMLVSLNAGERLVPAIVSLGDGGFAHQPVYGGGHSIARPRTPVRLTSC
jgi:hypothetical protein